MKKIVLFVFVLALPGSASSQTKTVPYDLAQALLVGANPLHDSPWVEIMVGGPPSRFVIDQLEGFTLLGSAGFAGSAVVIYQVKGDLDAAHELAMSQMKAAGWTSPLPRQRPYYIDSGFLGSDDMIPDGTNQVMLCKPDRAVMVMPLQIPSGPNVLRVVHMSNEMSSMCTAQMAERAMPRDPWSEAPLPRLHPPKDARVRNGGRGGGGEPYSINAFASTAMTNQQLIDHYATQMKAAGWELNGAAAEKNAAVQSWRKKQDQTDWMATLIVASAEGQMRMLQLNLFNLTTISRHSW